MENITLQVGVKVLLKNKSGKFLLLHRSGKYKNIPGSWDIPGGRIHPGTPLADNLIREVKEETGLKILDEPKLIAAQDILRAPGKHVVRLTYYASIKGDPIIDDESTDYKWLNFDELSEFEGLDIYVKELIKNGTIHSMI